MSTTPPSGRPRSLKRFSRVGFHPLPHHQDGNMGSSSDVEQGIPLRQVPTTGSRSLNQDSKTALWQQTSNVSSTTQKRGLFRGRRHKPEPSMLKTPTGWDPEEDTITTMGKFYKQILNFSIVTRYLLYVIPLATIFAIPIIVGSLNESDATLANVPLTWFFVWIEVVWVSLWVSKLVARLLPFIFQTLVGVISTGVRKYKVVIRALEIQISLVGWSVTALATFLPIMLDNPTSRYWAAHLDKSPVAKPDEQQNWQTIMQKVLGACVVATLLYLGEKLIIQLISINYHRKQYTTRIRDSKRNVWLLGLLYEASRTLFPQYCNEFAEEDYAIADQLNISRGLGLSSHNRSHNRTGSATPMRLIQDVGRIGDKITSAFGNVAHEITGREVFNPNSAHSVVVQALEHKRTSEALAKRIWMSLVVEGRDALTQEDIIDVLGVEHKEEAEEAFAILDRDANGDVSLDEMIFTVADFSRERKAIATSIHDVDQAINVLDRMLIVVVFVAVVLVFVAFLVSDFTTTLATAGTALLSLSFVFSVSCQEVLGSCIFLFVKHPYDIGDRVNVGGTPAGVNGNEFVVEHISLLFTVFRHMQGLNCGQLCQIPNILLNTLWIENTSRSKAMTEQFNMNISFDTKFEDLQILKNEMLNFVTDKDNSRDFMPSVDLDVIGTIDQSVLTLMVEIKHKSNWANESVRRSRRSKFICALIAALKAVPIYPPGGGTDAAGSAANPNYSVTITDEDAKKNADIAVQGRESARLVPLKQTISSEDTAATTSSDAKPSVPFLSLREESIIGDLTARNPLTDPSRDDQWNSSGGDSSTLGERPSIDRQDAEELRGILQRQSTRGKRKPPSNEHQSTVSTIYELENQGTMTSPRSPSNLQTTAYQPPSTFPARFARPAQPSSYENQPPQSSLGSAFQPVQRKQSTTSYQPSVSSQAISEQGSQQTEMRHLPPMRGPYPERSASIPHGRMPQNDQEPDESEKIPRPYPGV